MPKRHRSETPELEEEPRLRLTGVQVNNKGPDTDWDEKFVQQVLRELNPAQKSKKAKKDETWGDRNAKMVYEILSKASLPAVSNSTDNVANETEALYLSAEDVDRYRITADKFHPEVPVIVTGDIHRELDGNDTTRPIETFFKWQEDLDRTVSVQVPSNPRSKESYVQHSLAEVKEHFLFNDKKNNNDPEDEICKDDEPWNVLDCANPLPNSSPAFLNNTTSQLLHRIKDHVLGASSGTRIRATLHKWSQWYDIIEWALLSEGGNLTAPHQDAHALDTWIAVQEGAFGFGWMARPTYEENEEWMSDPLEETSTKGDKWRYVILKPGQTVFFPAGTIHLVFRVRGYQTLVTGGHNIRWNALEHWLQVMALQLTYPDACNEELDKAKQYITAVEYLITKRIEHGAEGDVLPAGFWQNGRNAKAYFKYIVQLIRDPNQPWNKKKTTAPRVGKKGAKKPGSSSKNFK